MIANECDERRAEFVHILCGMVTAKQVAPGMEEPHFCFEFDRTGCVLYLTQLA